ncbi:neuroligin-4, Y-linked-like [Macrosteles quadrilineatus]|uniref:neuroligin-4, Y-linked-like n=1 Tax=Macrosteles quadrilineatus TaxID=74068 RepID=UPI0023E2929B|nr:neuroligin-4, Y-linked-like [Macrosteles quadrilineatus]
MILRRTEATRRRRSKCLWLALAGMLLMGEVVQGFVASRVVRTKNGEVSGLVVQPESRHLDPVEVYRGVPYASPPTGVLRFMPPVTGALWSGVKNADRFSPVCPQRLPDIHNETAALKKMPRGRLEYLKRLLPYLSNQSEDCLYLNIYAPVQDRDTLAKYPVLVFIHGESYEWNSGNVYDGSVLASYGGLVVVTVNYRLGILGFLNANTDLHSRSPANYGLMDQIAALHWIQENVAFFGGDPSNVTLVGHGTGAACVHFLMTSSAVPDGLLFHRAILMSGSALSPWALVREPARFARQVAKHVNCSPEMPHPHLLKCLRERPLEALLSTPIDVPEFSTAFGPSVDGVVIDNGNPEPRPSSNQESNHGQYNEYSASGPGRPAAPAHDPHTGGYINLNNPLARKAMVAKMSRYDLLLGVVKAEAYTTFSGDDVQYGIESERRTRILRTFVRNTYRYHLSEILATIANEYTDWERPVQHPINIRDETLEALSDAQVVAPVIHTADLHSSARRNSYLYVFDYQSKFGDYPQRQGCIHGEELPYVFGAPLVAGMMHFPRNYTKAEILLSEATILYWSNFARTGNPNEPQDADLVHGFRQEKNRFKNIEWAPYESVHKKYICLDIKPKLKNHYRAHRLSFWLNLVPDLHRPGGDDVPRTHHQLETDDHPHLFPAVPSSRKPPHDTTTDSVGQGVLPSPSYDNSSLGLYMPPVVVVAPSSSDRGSAAQESSDNSQQEDGFAAYSTALSVTIAIGCSLLLLNVLIFAGVYYQRDKGRHGDSSPASNNSTASCNSTLKKRQENGGPMSNICVTGGPTELLQIMETRTPTSIPSILKTPTSDTTLLVLQPPQSHRLPPAEFTDGGTLPRPPPPPKVVKPPAQAETQPLLAPHGSIQLISTHPGTLGRKHTQGKPMEELRV